MPKKLIPLIVLIVAWNSFQKVEKVKERVAKSQPSLFINLHYEPLIFVDNKMLYGTEMSKQMSKMAELAELAVEV